MRKLLAFLTALALLFGVGEPAQAGSADIAVKNAWSRASMGKGRPGAAYFDIQNNGDEAAVVTGLKSDLATMPQIHRTLTNSEGISSMEPADKINIAPGETVALEPGGLHAMLMQLQRPMIKGDSFTLTLIFSDGGEVSVDVPILRIAAQGPED